MKVSITSFIKIGMIVSVMAILLYPVTVFAWGDNSGGRQSYTVEEINNGAIGATPQSDGEDYKNSDNYPGQILFNSISDSEPIGGSEKNYVATRECVLLEDGSWEGATKDTIWNANDITVEDGKYYIIRLYVHNNNPNSWDAVAEDVHVSFSIPADYDKENERIQVNGFIDSSNATPSEYWDYVNFNSEVPFHLEFINNSGLLENNGIGLGGLILSDDIVKAKSGGVLIGYDALDGRIPGCYQYDNFVTIKVRAVFDYEYTVEQKVRLAESNDDWEDVIEAKIGDKVEFRIGYRNTSDKKQYGVVIKDILPSNLKYVEGSSIIKNTSHREGAKILNDALIENGIRIGNYKKDGNAYIYFTAEVVDENLEIGANTLTNWSQAGVGQKTIQDYASVILYKNAAWFSIVTKVLLALIIFCLVLIVILLIYRHRINGNHKKR
ncbi:hypothetical protein AALA98_14635 [Lachnospiraceae bacterium 45-W7]